MTEPYIFADYSFFKLASDDIDTNVILAEDIISLTIVEEMNNITVGSLRLNDPNLLYSKILKGGANLDVSWGYQEGAKVLLDQLEFSGLDSLQKGSMTRGLKCFVTSPGGSADASGVMSYSCNLQARGMRGNREEIVHEEATKQALIEKLFNTLGITTKDIRFARGSEAGNSQRQWETDFAFLTRLSFEFRTVFSLGYDSDNELVGYFLDPPFLKSSPIVKSLGFDFNKFTYGQRNSIVLDYSWKDASYNNANGQGIQMRIGADGEPQLIRYIVETQTVVTYKLRPDKIEAELRRRNDVKSQYQFVTEAMAVRNFEEIEQYFDEVESSTAPQGIGLSFNINTLGNPFYVVGGICQMESGFIEAVSGVDFYLNKVVHSISNAGYRCACEVVDTFTLSPTGERL